MTFETLHFDRTGGVARITLNRPDANSINLTLAQELLKAAIRCDHDPAIRSVLLTGAGRFFCAGGDLRAMAEFGDGVAVGLKELTTYLHASISVLRRMRPPLVVAVNGVAAGAGMSLAAIGDVVVAAETATFTMAYTGVGLVPDGASTYFLPRLIGLRRTQELMLTNRRLTAAEAAEWGLVSRVVADDALESEAGDLAHALADGPTEAFGAVKRLLDTSFANSLETQMEQEGREIAAVAGSGDGREGIAAFLGKRRPTFRGT